MSEITAREFQIIDLIADGYDREGIAEYLDISPSSVRVYINRMCERYGCKPKELPGVLRGDTSEKSGVDQ